MEIKRLSKEDLNEFKSLIVIFNSEFENSNQISDDVHLLKLLSRDDFFAFAIVNKNKVIGGLTLYSLSNYSSNRPMAFIYDVAISREYQGRGFGKYLISEVKKFCKVAEFDFAFVEAELDDESAIEFYRKTGINEEINVKQFTYKFTSAC